MTYIILSISDSDKHFDSAIKEYQKRLGKSLKIENVKPTRNGSVEQIIQKDTQNIINTISKRFGSYKKVLLSKEGENLNTDQIFDFCKKNNDVIFIIGGPYGFDEKLLKKNIDLKISFGSITLQHGLAKLILLEQLYRITMISQNKSYHY
ncbi:MAG: 23S rRNA (pseudouridine(1915)-N(3))-methyltransferase RlmH [Candidatus Absconditicoccaceae bacterium]